jgi:hypothetical protein
VSGEQKVAMANSPKLAIAADRTILAPNLAVCAADDGLPATGLDYTEKLFNHTEKGVAGITFCACKENCGAYIFCAVKVR